MINNDFNIDQLSKSYIKHPWQQVPTELILYALKVCNRESNFYQRTSYLLLDVGVETLLKVYLNLPNDVTKAKNAYSKRRQVLKEQPSFYSLLQAVREAAGDKIKDINLSHVNDYHNTRNKLYHESDGITVSPDKVKKYADCAVELLYLLLDVDLREEYKKDKEKHKKDEEEQQITLELNELKEEKEKWLNNLHFELELCIEKIEPKLLFPSFKIDLSNINLTEPIEGLIEKTGIIENTFNVDIYECFSDSDKALVNKHLNKFHGSDISQYPSPKHITLEVISGWIDWEEVHLTNLSIGSYRVNNLRLSDFTFCKQQDLTGLYFKIIYEIMHPNNKGASLNSFINGSIITLEEKSIREHILETKKDIETIKGLCSSIKGWRTNSIC